MFWDRLTYSADSSARRRCFIVLAVRNGFDRQRHVAVPLLGEPAVPRERTYVRHRVRRGDEAQPADPREERVEEGEKEA